MLSFLILSIHSNFIFNSTLPIFLWLFKPLFFHYSKLLVISFWKKYFILVSSSFPAMPSLHFAITLSFIFPFPNLHFPIPSASWSHVSIFNETTIDLFKIIISKARQHKKEQVKQTPIYHFKIWSNMNNKLTTQFTKSLTFVCIEPPGALPPFDLGGSPIRSGGIFSPKISRTGRTTGGLEEPSSFW